MVKKVKEHIGQKIKRIRAYKGMKQEDLANAIGKTRSLVSHFERTGIINKYTLKEIAQALKIDMDSLESISSDTTLEALADTETALSKSSVTATIIERQQQEIISLKETVQHQWKLLHELARKR